MYNIKTDTKIDGNIEFTGDLIGKIPTPEISTDSDNSLEGRNNGLYVKSSTGGLPEFTVENYINAGTKNINDSVAYFNLLFTGTPKPDAPTAHFWLTDIENLNLISNSFTTIPTEHGKYVTFMGISDNLKTTATSASYYMSDDYSVIILLASADDTQNTVIVKNTKTDYNNLKSNGTYLMLPYTGNDVLTYNAPFDSKFDTAYPQQPSITVYVQKVGEYITQVVMGIENDDPDNIKNGISIRTSDSTGSFTGIQWEKISTGGSTGIVLASSDYQDPALTVYGNGTEDSPLWFKVNTAMIDNNRIENLKNDEGVGLYVAPEQLAIDPSNIIQYKNEGLFVSGRSPIIPKFAAATLGMQFSGNRISYPNGSFKIRSTLTMTNPTGVSNYNNVSLYEVLTCKPKHYFLDAAGNPIPIDLQAEITSRTPSTLTVTVTLFVYGVIDRAYNILDDVQYPENGTTPTTTDIKVYCLVGTTPSILGM